MGFSTMRRYERELVSVSDDFYAVSSRCLRLGDNGLAQMKAPPLIGMRWGEAIPDLSIQGPLPLGCLDGVVPVGMSVNGVRLALMLEEDNDERRRCNQQIRFDDVKETAKVELSMNSSATKASVVEVEIAGQNIAVPKVIIREKQAGKLLTEIRLMRFPSRGRGKYYLEIVEFGAL